MVGRTRLSSRMSSASSPLVTPYPRCRRTAPPGRVYTRSGVAPVPSIEQNASVTLRGLYYSASPCISLLSYVSYILFLTNSVTRLRHFMVPHVAMTSIDSHRKTCMTMLVDGT